MNHYLEPWRKYAKFGGRALRREFWTFTLINYLLGFIAGAISVYFNVTVVNYLNCGSGNLDAILNAWKFIMIPFVIFGLAIIIPSISVTVRRLHDTNHSGWWLLIGFIPLIGQLWLLTLLITDSPAGENKYGPNPRTISATSK